MKGQDYFQSRQQSRARQKPIGNKNIRNRRIRNDNIKIKKVLPQFKYVEVKQSTRVVRGTAVRQKTIYSAENRRVQYCLYKQS